MENTEKKYYKITGYAMRPHCRWDIRTKVWMYIYSDNWERDIKKVQGEVIGWSRITKATYDKHTHELVIKDLSKKA